MSAEEIIAAVLFYANYILSAIAVILAVMLYRRSRNCGWLVLACAFLSPFVFLGWRLIQREHVLAIQYNWRFPCFYAAMVAGLLLIKRDGPKKQ
ncbi:MAG TPA: hypothetical protein VFB72_16245 [Verrucomicrobiae bacterium]|nr:hypothetical protein [Verrucomicrobiae bacterium]